MKQLSDERSEGEYDVEGAEELASAQNWLRGRLEELGLSTQDVHNYLANLNEEVGEETGRTPQETAEEIVNGVLHERFGDE